MNKREAAEALGVSERTLTDWQQRGMPYVAGGPGREGQYDEAAIERWADANGLGARSAPRRALTAQAVAEDITRALSGRIVGKLLSDALVPGVAILMDSLDADLARARAAFCTLGVLLVALNDRNVGAEVEYHISGCLEDLAGDGDARARVRDRINQCYAEMRARRAWAPQSQDEGAP